MKRVMKKIGDFVTLTVFLVIGGACVLAFASMALDRKSSQGQAPMKIRPSGYTGE